MVPTSPTVPLPRRPLDTGDPVRHWYENALGWATVPGRPENSGYPVELVTGLRFDVLEVPAEAGFAALRHLGPASPVVLHGDRMRVLVAAGGADELPGLLDWLEWGSLALDLSGIGAGGTMAAPPPPGLDGSQAGSQGAAMWLRPPEPGCEIEPSLPTLSAVGGVGGAPDLVRLVDTMATQCHRVRLRSASAQPLAFS
ncbi:MULTISPECIES: SCO3374 family protein [unclassified Streptomyces]|uniref:SCO3374 family protein n=1 Tax=unclassified Streptomyces TaxID=2593676 RepID=UPI0033AB7731